MAGWLEPVSVLGIYFARMAELRTKRDTIPGPVRETRTLRWFVLIGTLMLLGGLGEFFWKRPGWSPATFALGWVCALASIGIRRRAIAALGKFWSLHVEIRESHEFVRTGPFRWMRHPTYFSMTLELLARVAFAGGLDGAGRGRALHAGAAEPDANRGNGAGGEVR